MSIKKLFYKPNIYKIAIDVIAWISTLAIMLIWRVSSEKASILNYVYVFTCILIYWLAVAYFSHRYKPRNTYKFLNELGIVLIVSLIVFCFGRDILVEQIL